MPNVPATINSPANWIFHVTGAGNETDGSAIQWVANSGFAETPGQSLSGFSFDSATTPAQMAGLNQFYSNPRSPVTTAFIYSGAPFSDAGGELAVAATPEPSSILLTLLGGGLILGTLRRRS
jgi:hypothetical protein